MKTIDKPGHLIVANDCGYGKTTMFPGYYVSSVGEYKCKSATLARADARGFTTIGCDRYYETFVFRWGGGHCECGCGIPSPISWSEIDSLGANTREECEANHAKLVKKWLAVSKRRKAVAA